jgi:hypothetical protein
MSGNDIETLPSLIEQAMAALNNATTAAEVLDARDQAKVAYDAAKSAARFAKAKSAHATILAMCHRMQADALTIEARAQTRLADEYTRAQDRGEVQQHGGQGKRDIPDQNIPLVTDIGLTSKEVYEARQVRDAENIEPGIVKKTVEARLDAGEEPTRADVKRAVKRAATPTGKPTPPPKPSQQPELKKKPLYCSFCGKSQHEVRKLIAGPTVTICDECVGLCLDIIKRENDTEKPWEFHIVVAAVQILMHVDTLDDDVEERFLKLRDHLIGLTIDKVKRMVPKPTGAKAPAQKPARAKKAAKAKSRGR